MDNSTTNLYVGNIDPRVTREQLYELFVQACPVVSLRYPRDKVLQTPQGYAFVGVPSVQDADYAVQLLHNCVTLHGRPLKIRRARPDSAEAADTAPVARLYVGGLAATVDAQQLARVFGKFGALYRPPTVHPAGEAGRRYALVEFRSYGDADAALDALAGATLAGGRVSVAYARRGAGGRGPPFGSQADRHLNAEARRNGRL
ncbi:U2 snRNP complex subunit HSH49 KNAG_0G03260 [Huiozyma naganishii CBS 8797]|uniref:RRM domain-containing protein n=1 Tax=Huiozyma naganishii (strain ATCC MYA-139 / BCRC 22969 / CBS 8797 / KCTC 17520 / NBRC 10181 / NCYC 3082 / Yp74L-3) TaxID=1071383 RepID=J7RP06_HUIN7|nr:hypothetical protein KNAG_0G03260 [Kazachstania naganishii CBS 8797]CCK71383.1 hypothetical protein KNAG_0G03260 [Kazachstania naganishii CBS 8797]